MQRSSSFTWPLVLALFLLACLPACRFGSSGPDERGYTLVYLKTGEKTKLSDEESKTIFAGHFANMQRLAKEKKLLLAGPFGQPKHDIDLRGLFVLDTDDPVQAQAWAETDPGFQAHVFKLEYHPLRTQAALRALLDQELARMAAEDAAGEHPAPGANGRSYVLLTAQLGIEMEREIAGETFTLLHGRIDGGLGWAVIDATDPNAAIELIGASREKMGTALFDAWFATKGLEQLPTLVDG
jgi:uncharacterized protein YciI